MLQPTRLISTPFAQEGDKTEIQNVTGEFDNSATYRLGFPPLTMQSIRLGGKPPKGTDFNGVLFDITENISFLCKGGRYQYNAGLSTLIGGYPEGSNLLLDDNVTEVVSTVAGNQNNPNINMTGWILKPNRTTAANVADASGETQQQVNYNGGSKWHSRVGGYLKNERVVLANGDIVKSTVDGNTNNPNVNMTGWVKTNNASQIFDVSGKTQQEINNQLPVDVRKFGAKCDGVTDDTQAVKDGIAFVSAIGGCLEFPSICAVYDEIVVDANLVKLSGVSGKTNAGLSLKTANAKLRFGGNGTLRYLNAVENFLIIGNNIASTLIEFKDAGEASIDNLHLAGSTDVGLKFTGRYANITSVNGLHTNGVPNPVLFLDGGNVWFTKCNLYNSDKVFKFQGDVKGVSCSDTWMETYNYVLDFDNTLGAIDIFGLTLRNCYFQNTLGLEAKTSRIVRSYCSNENRNRVYGLTIADSNIHHTASEVLIEVLWNGNTAGGENKLHGEIDGIINTSPVGISAFIKSDVINNDIPWVDLKYRDTNYNYIQIPVNANTNISGGVQKILVNTATFSASDQAPLYITANTLPTTITSITGGQAGQYVKILVRDPFTTFDFSENPNLYGNKGNDYSAASGDLISCCYDGSVWQCSVVSATRQIGSATLTTNEYGVAAITHTLGNTAKMFKVSVRGNTPYLVTTLPNNSAETCAAFFYNADGSIAGYKSITFDWEASL